MLCNTWACVGIFVFEHDFFLYDETRNMRKRNKRKQDRNEIRCLLNAVRHSEHLKCMTCVMCLGFSGGGDELVVLDFYETVQISVTIL